MHTRINSLSLSLSLSPLSLIRIGITEMPMTSQDCMDFFNTKAVVEEAFLNQMTNEVRMCAQALMGVSLQ